MIRALAGGDDLTRDLAISVLGDIRDPRAVKPLLKILNDKDENATTRMFVANALGEIGDWRAFDDLSLISASSIEDVTRLDDDHDFEFLQAVDEAIESLLEKKKLN